MGDFANTFPDIVLLNGHGTHWETYFSSLVAHVTAGFGLGLGFVISAIVMLVARHPSIKIGLGPRIKTMDRRLFAAVGAFLFLVVIIKVMVFLVQNNGLSSWYGFVAAVTAGSGLGLGFFIPGIVMKLKGIYARTFAGVGVLLFLAVFLAVWGFMERNKTPLF